MALDVTKTASIEAAVESVEGLLCLLTDPVDAAMIAAAPRLRAISNMAAIATNGGYMPATPEAIASMGRTAPTIYSNSAVVASPNLPWLIDRFALPRWLPFANVISVGDILLAVGVFVLLVAVMRRGRRPVTPTAPTSAEPA